MMFKVGDIVECVRDFPYGADIKKGELAVIKSIDMFNDIHFDNYPEEGYSWAGSPHDFILHTVDLENK